MARVVLAMSGGVDSSAAAVLLRRAGHEVIGLFMRHGEPVAKACAVGEKEAGNSKSGLLPIVTSRLEHKQGCCTASDAEDARRVADRLDVPFYALDFQEEFSRIIDYFVDEYSAARTPNPCVMCNNWLKFGKLFDYADSVGAEYVATGHYARLVPSDDPAAPPALLRGLDADKDQSYVLFGVERRLLGRMVLPIGDYQKSEIRELAREAGLRVADKKDSQDICFVSSGQHGDFVRRRRGDSQRGEIVTTAGEVVGQHPGLEHFTIGQRKGLGVAFGEPRYVVRIEADSRRVVVGTREELARRSLTASGTNWLADAPSGEFRGSAQIRYNAAPAAATMRVPSPGALEVTFDEPQLGVAPGQAVVCYAGDRVLGGGWIDS